MSVFDTLSPAEVAVKMQEILMGFKEKIDGLKNDVELRDIHNSNAKMRIEELESEIAQDKELLELSRKSIDKLTDQLDEARNDHAHKHNELEKMSKDLLTALDERDKLRGENSKMKESVETLVKLGAVMEEKLKKLEDEIAGRMKGTGFDYECTIENHLSQPVEIKYKDKPLTINKFRNSLRSTKLSFRMDTLVQYDELAYYIGGQSMSPSKLTGFTYKQLIAKPALYRMEILSYSFPGLIKVKVNDNVVISNAQTITFKGLNLRTAFTTTIRFKGAPGLKKEDVKVYRATVDNPEYVLYEASAFVLIGDLVQI